MKTLELLEESFLLIERWHSTPDVVVEPDNDLLPFRLGHEVKPTSTSTKPWHKKPIVSDDEQSGSQVSSEGPSDNNPESDSADAAGDDEHDSHDAGSDQDHDSETADSESSFGEELWNCKGLKCWDRFQQQKALFVTSLAIKALWEWIIAQQQATS